MGWWKQIDLMEKIYGRKPKVKVFFIAKIKDLNSEYREYSNQLRELAESHPGFIAIESEEIGDIEITVSTWRSKQYVADWAQNPEHVEAKKRAHEWYHWVRGKHVETKE